MVGNKTDRVFFAGSGMTRIGISVMARLSDQHTHEHPHGSSCLLPAIADLRVSRSPFLTFTAFGSFDVGDVFIKPLLSSDMDRTNALSFQNTAHDSMA